MSAPRPITIVGGGLAGLTLGIALRRQSIPVAIWEYGRYPRHRVCGEFINGRGQETLARLGLRSLIDSAGAIQLHTAAFFSPRARSPVRALTQPAISISRHELDALLANEFRRLGGELREGERWRENDFLPGIVRATGRRLQPVCNGWRWFGLKVHARNVALGADLELHVRPSGYMGISWLPGRGVNICGLFRRNAESSESPLDWAETLRGIPGTALRERLANATFDESSFCSVAGLSLEPRRASSQPECSIGDAITMIAPVTGNGMSMAFESAEIAAEPIAAYCSGKLDWDTARARIAAACDQRFHTRLLWARWLQKLMFHSWLQTPLVLLAPRPQWLWRLLLARTR